jgi:ATP-dependent exoDNAse (exonuclease V) beta subunit
LWPAVKHEYAEAFSAGTNVSETNGVSGVTFEVPPFRRFRVPFGLPEPPEIPGRQGRSQGLASKADIEFYWVGMAARQAGTIVHRWLKRFSQRGADIEPAMIASLRPATLRMATELGVPEAVLEVVCDRVEKSLLGVLNDPRGQWLVTGDGFSELPLSGRWEDSIVSVVIDRVRINEGVHWVVDYKTSSHEGGDLQRFLDQEGERYRQQLLKYVTLYRRLVEVPVRAGLYFPLLQEFREVAID